MELKELRGEDMSSEKTTMKSLGDSTALREKFCEFSQAALNKVNEIYALLSKPCIVIEDVRELCREARGILYNPPVDEVPVRNCDTDKDGKTLLDDYISMKGITSENQVGALYDLALPVIVWLLSSAAERKGEHDGSK